MVEEWRPVLGYEGRYEVSNMGRLRSTRFRSNGSLQLMKSTRNYAGYHVVTLGVERKQLRLHCLVLEAFIGPRPEGMLGCHNDSNKDNNHLGNLRWDTPKGNIADRRSYKGENNPRAVLNNSETQEISRLSEQGISPNVLAKLYGVTRTRICQVTKEGHA